MAGLLDKSYQLFKKYWRRKTNYKGQWTIEMECERLFFSRKKLFEGVQPFLRVYDIGESLDSIEAKMETIGKDIKHFLVTKANLDELQFKWELILKDNLGKIGEEEEFIDTLTKMFLKMKKNLSPLVPNRTTIVSQVIDRHLYAKEKLTSKENDIIKLISALFATKLNVQ